MPPGPPLDPPLDTMPNELSIYYCMNLGMVHLVRLTHNNVECAVKEYISLFPTVLLYNCSDLSDYSSSSEFKMTTPGQLFNLFCFRKRLNVFAIKPIISKMIIVKLLDPRHMMNRTNVKAADIERSNVSLYIKHVP